MRLVNYITGVTRQRACTLLIDTGSNIFDFCNYRVRNSAQKWGGRIENVDLTVDIADQRSIVVKEVCYVEVCLTNSVLRTTTRKTVKCYVTQLPGKADIVIGWPILKADSTLKAILFAKLIDKDDIDWIPKLVDQARKESKKIKESQSSGSHRDLIVDRLRDLNAIMEAEKHSSLLPKIAAAHQTVELDRSNPELTYSRGNKDQVLSQGDIPGVLLAASSQATQCTSADVQGSTPNSANHLPINIEGDSKTVAEHLEICEQFRSCFSKKLNSTPARIPPMKLVVSPSWESKDNRRPPRPQGPVREADIKRQTDEMLESDVIRRSTASAHSQVLLIRKTDGSWRFCVDYRRLNALTEGVDKFPIPNIQTMLRRLGDRKPKYFALMDLTKGYYQAPLCEASKHHTAFITATGLFEWNRVPMGLMGAPSYFQRVMTTHVLAGLMYNACEVFMDDIIVFGEDKASYYRNLKAVLQRLQDHGLTVNPDKTYLGKTSIEYVGHVLDSEGLTFSREKIEEVIQFPTPRTLGEIKSFIGLSNFLRDNIRNMSDITQPLNQILTTAKYTKKKRNHTIIWTDEAIEAFERIKREINECPKLFFIDDSSPIHLYTDASLYGIGAYLCQLRDGKEHAIAFMSKTLTEVQRKWSTPEREAFAIVEAFDKFAYLIRDTHFTLHTDHENLIHIRDTGSPKVFNWKLKIQEFDFDVQHIDGECNVVADRLSRNPAASLCKEIPEHEGVTSLDKLELHPGLRDLKQQQFQPILGIFNGVITKDKLKILESVHNENTGHNGVAATCAKLQEAGYGDWNDMEDIVKKYISECDCCQKSNVRKIQIHVEPFTLAGYELMANRCIDTIGPFPADKDGNKYIIVIIDTFSRWIELYPSKENDAVSAASALYQHFGTFGLPKWIGSDLGVEYRNNLVKHFLALVGVEHKTSIAHSHEQNGIVERANKEVRRYINDIVYDKRLAENQWSEYLPTMKRIYNSLKKQLTGYSPAEILYAGSLKLNEGMFPEAGVNKDAVEIMRMPWEQWLEQRRVAQQVAMDSVREKSTKHHATHMAKDSGIRTEFPIGSWVLKAYPPSEYGSGKPSKQVLEHTGPFLVKGVDQAGAYWLEDPKNRKQLRPCNIHLLRPYIIDEGRTNPLEIRCKDTTDEYIVESITGHSGSMKRKPSLKFNVKWIGYEEETLEPWANLRNNSILHEYLRAQNLHQHIPVEFRSELL